MMKSDYPLSKEEFDYFYSKVARLTVEVLLFEEGKGVFLTLRDIEPFKGQWHLPGGTVLFGEPVTGTVKRIAKREVGINVKQCHLIDYMEYPTHYKNGLDSPVGLVFQIDEYSGSPASTTEAIDGKWFLRAPHNMLEDQNNWLLNHGYLKS